MTSLVSRQATASAAPVAYNAEADELMIRAKQIASAPRDMLPKHYQNSPGACLLAVDWATRNDVSIFEALGEVSFVHGKPVVSAVLQKKLAARSGYRTQRIEGDDKSCTVAVIGPDGEEVGRCEYTIKMAQDFNLTKNPIWKADPGHMLYKRATTRALEYYGPSELAPFMAEPTAEVERAAERQETPLGADQPPAPAPEGEQEPETIDGTAQPTEDDLRAAMKAKGLKVADVMRSVQEMHPEAGLGTLEAVAGHDEAAFDLADWIDQQ